MSYCPYCGQQLSDGMRFCPSCGAAQPAAETLVEAAPAYVQAVPVQTVPVQTVPVQTVPVNDYRVILLACGSCTKTTARELFQDILGYTVTQARTLTNETPIEIATALSFQQAVSLAQLFTEYGMQIAVSNSAGYVDISPYATSSVFNSAGTLAAATTATLATLSTINRVDRFLRWTQPDPFRFLFAPRYRPLTPPKYTRRPPAPRPPAPPRQPARPAAPRQPAPKPQLRNDHASRPGGGPKGGPSGGGHGGNHGPGGPGGRR